jgi:hypothetical protein
MATHFPTNLETPDSVESCTSTAQQYIQRGTDQIAGMVADRPSRSLLIACATGFGLGLLAMRLFGSSPARSSFDRGSAERFGRNLLDKLEHALPGSIRERMGK